MMPVDTSLARTFGPMPRHGTLRFMTVAQRYELYVVRGPNCWGWAGAINTYGYGRMRTGKGYDLAHRLSYKLARGPIPKGMCVCHQCDNRLCSNPCHLFLATSVENTEDRQRKGRGASGARAHSAKLSDEQVAELRARWGRGGITKAEIGRIYGITDVAAGLIVRGITYKRREVAA